MVSLYFGTKHDILLCTSSAHDPAPQHTAYVGRHRALPLAGGREATANAAEARQPYGNAATWPPGDLGLGVGVGGLSGVGDFGFGDGVGGKANTQRSNMRSAKNTEKGNYLLNAAQAMPRPCQSSQIGSRCL